jgi:glucan phosphoethanolaminetransferase (alkaline phosphatase superfamily)
VVWTFRILAAVNVLLLLAAFFYQAPGEDPAGAGLRLGFAVVYAIALAMVLLLYRFVKTLWPRVPLLVVLALPLLSIVYGIGVSL